MQTISIEFIALFTVGVIFFWLTPSRLRWLSLLVWSYVFYSFSSLPYFGLLLFATISSFYSAKFLTRSADKASRARFCALAVALNLVPLLAFKYLEASIHPASGWLLPLGLSYYSFVQIGYILDVFHDRVKPETRLGVYANFVAFFPVIPAGPIERSTTLLPQLQQLKGFNEARVVEGLRLVLWGVVKKILIANRLSTYVANVYDHPHEFAGLPLFVATLLFAFQIYCDFSAYSDIALGLARILGIQLTINFRQPYFSLSLQEFWQRWHISLSTWIRDYMFFPITRTLLGIVRSQNLARFAAYAIVMGLIGLWHGFSLTLLVWGLLHGFLLGFESLVQWQKVRVPNALKLAVTFFFVLVTWVFFRANSLADAVYILSGWINLDPNGMLLVFGESISNLAIAGALIMVILAVDLIDIKWGINKLLSKLAWPLRWAAYYALIFATLSWGIWSEPEFIYFQF